MDPQELLREAQLLFVTGKDKESIEAYTKAIEAGADPYIAHLSRGATYLKLKEGDKALNDFSKAISANSQSARAYYYRGLIYMMKEEFEKAASDFSKALELKTDYLVAEFSRAISCARMNKPEEASKDLSAVMPQLETNLQSFADTYGIVRTEIGKVMAQLTGERKIPTLELDKKELDTLEKWLEEE